VSDDATAPDVLIFRHVAAISVRGIAGGIE
jgi:hypothetical protein